MPNNLFITGVSGVGKTTVLQKAARLLQREGLREGGVYCPEIREKGKRKGFRIVDVLSHREAILSHAEAQSGPAVGRYRVQVQNVDELCGQAFPAAFEQADYLLIDEIAPMELYSKVFVKYVQQAIDSAQPVLAVIHQKSRKGLIGQLKKRPDIQLFEVTQANRETLPRELAEQMRKVL